MPWFEHGTSRIYYEDEGPADGSAQAVLLLPGLTDSIELHQPLRVKCVPVSRHSRHTSWTQISSSFPIETMPRRLSLVSERETVSMVSPR